MFDPIKEAVCPRLKSCWPCVRPDFAVHRLNRKGLLLLLLIRTPISPTVIIILPSHCCSVYYAVQDFFFSPTYFRHARLIPVDVRVTSQHTRDSVFQSWKSWKGGMKWEANNKKYKVLGKRREKKRKLSADFCVRDDITTEHSVGDIKGTSQPSTLFFPSKFFFFSIGSRWSPRVRIFFASLLPTYSILRFIRAGDPLESHSTRRLADGWMLGSCWMTPQKTSIPG